MSKISEQKALEAYPIKIDRIYYGLPLLNGAEPFTDDVNIHQRNAYIQGYDQAMQDFMEKAMEYLIKNLLVSDLEHRKYLCMTEENKDNFIQDFKNHMQDE